MRLAFFLSIYKKDLDNKINNINESYWNRYLNRLNGYVDFKK